MLRQGFIHVASAFCLLAAGLGPAFGVTSPAADTNGDRAVDILDLQIAIAELLSPEATAKLSDVNGDGVVDILDVQSILNQAGETTAPEDPGEQPGTPEGLSLPAPPQPHADGLTPLREARIPLAGIAPVCPLPVASDVDPPPSVFRLVRGLSPHAPPSPARGSD